MFGVFVATSAFPSLLLGLTWTASPAEESEADTAQASPEVALPLDPEVVPHEVGNPRVMAGEAFESGRQAFDRGDYEAAIEDFERAQSFVPHPDTKYNLGVAHQRAGNSLRAWRIFDELDRNAKDEQVRQDARARRSETEAHIALLRLILAPDARACLDDHPLTLDEHPLPLEPGSHSLVVNNRLTSIELAAGELRVVHIDAPRRSANTSRPAILGLLGVGIGGSAAATGLGVAAATTDLNFRRRNLAIGAASAAAVGLAGSTAALVLHMRARDRGGRASSKGATPEACAVASRPKSEPSAN
jgi:hypothetical protein